MAGRNITEFKYFQKYSKVQYHKYQKTGKVNIILTEGDEEILVSLPKIVKGLSEAQRKAMDPKPKRYRPGKAAMKRKLQVVEDLMDEEPNEEQENHCPNKRAKTGNVVDTHNILALTDKFGSFVTNSLQIEPSRNTEVIMSDSRPKFLVHCHLCPKKIQISYKVSKIGNICFVKSNYFAHKCNKVTDQIVSTDILLSSENSGEVVVSNDLLVTSEDSGLDIM